VHSSSACRADYRDHSKALGVQTHQRPSVADAGAFYAASLASSGMVCRNGLACAQFHARSGAARLNVMSSYPDPLFVSNETGRPSSRFGALSQIVSVSPSRT
jgi:hypothetical protein